MTDDIPKFYNIYELSKDEKIKCITICALMLFIIAYIFYHSVFVAVCLMTLSVHGPRIYSNHMAKKRRSLLRSQFKDALYSISASVATGRQLPEALRESADSMKKLYGEQALITKELRHVSRKILDLKEREDEVLREFALRTGLQDIINFVDIYSTCRAAGGDLIKVLGKTAGVIIDKISIDREIEVMVAQKKLEIKILAAMPPAVILFMQFSSASYISVMYTTLGGRLIMTAALGAIAGAYVLSSRIIDIEM